MKELTRRDLVKLDSTVTIFIGEKDKDSVNNKTFGEVFHVNNADLIKEIFVNASVIGFPQEYSLALIEIANRAPSTMIRASVVTESDLVEAKERLLFSFVIYSSIFFSGSPQITVANTVGSLGTNYVVETFRSNDGNQEKFSKLLDFQTLGVNWIDFIRPEIWFAKILAMQKDDTF